MTTLANSHAPFVSPLTGAPLQPHEGRLGTADGAESYPVQGGIASFLRHPSAEDAQTVERLERMNDATRRLGWRAGLESGYGHGGGVMRHGAGPSRRGC